MTRFLVLSGIVGALIVAPVGARAATITVGSPLTAPFNPSQCTQGCTLLNRTLSEPGALATSPVDGVVIRWRILQGSSEFPYRLRVLTPGAGTSYTGTATSAAQYPAGPGLEVFPTNLPIRAGQTIGIDTRLEAPFGFFEEAGGAYAFTEPPFADRIATATKVAVGEVAFNADIELAPSQAGIDPGRGSTACVVPNLRGRTLKAARRRLKRAGCRLGRVRGEKTNVARVVRQQPKPGRVLPPRAKVNVKLAE